MSRERLDYKEDGAAMFECALLSLALLLIVLGVKQFGLLLVTINDITFQAEPTMKME
jgi:hypothetical protein